MISTIHDSTMVDVPWRNEEVLKKPICIFQYNMFMKGVDRADQYLSYYSHPQALLRSLLSIS